MLGEKKINVTEIIVETGYQDPVKDINQKVKSIEEKFQYIFSKHEFVKIKDAIEANDNVDTPKSSTETQMTTVNTCKECWVFKKKMCTICSGVSKSRDNEIIPFHIRSNEQLEIGTKEDACQLCWIFSKTDKCGICKKSNNVNLIHHTKVTENNIIIPEVITKQTQELIEKLLKKWTCHICLTDNDTDRLNCICCDSENYKNGGLIKIKFGAEHALNVIDKKSSTLKESISFTPISTVSESEFSKTFNTYTPLNNMDILEKIEAPNMKMPTKMEHENSFVDYAEMMEVEEEIVNEATIPILNQPIHQEIFPNSFNPIIPTLNSPFHFEIGVNFEQRKVKHPRYRQPLKRMATSFHK